MCDSEIDEGCCTPPEVAEMANIATLKLLPEKSRKVYEISYNRFREWCANKGAVQFTENVLLAFFSDRSTQIKPSSLWSEYSMVRASLSVKDNVDIKKYAKLMAFMKRNSVGFRSKKSKIFNREQIYTFLKEAPESEYLMKKVVAIFGIAGACRRDELQKMTTDDIEEVGSVIIVKIPRSKTDKERSFVVKGEVEEGLNLIDIYRKYANLRPKNTPHKRFFIHYRNGKCSVQVVGVNTFAKVPCEIAKYLNLPNTGLYTGHCFRRSSATLLADTGADILSLKRHGGWKSTSVAEGYIEESIGNKITVAGQIFQKELLADSTEQDQEDGLPLEGGTMAVSPDGNTTTSTLSFTPTASDHGLTLSCRASNQKVPHSEMRDTWMLRVLYPPKVTLTLGHGLNANEIKEGADVYFECHLVANPWVLRVWWLRDGHRLLSNGTAGVIVSNQTLVLQGVSRGSSGRYYCEAANSEGNTRSPPFQLRVKFEPVCGEGGGRKVLGAAKGEPLKIECKVDAEPAASLFRWIFNSTPGVSRELSEFTAEPGSSILTYTPSIAAHYGTLQCWGRNELGSQQTPCVYHIVPAGRPDPPNNCAVLNVTHHSAIINCKKGFDGGLRQKFVLLIMAADNLTANISASAPEFQVTILDASTDYSATAFSINAKGWSKGSAPIFIKTLPAPGLKELRRSTGPSSEERMEGPWLYILLAAGSTLIFAATIGAIIFAVRRFKVDSPVRERRARSPKREETPLNPQVSAYTDTATDDKNPDLIPPPDYESLHSDSATAAPYTITARPSTKRNCATQMPVKPYHVTWAPILQSRNCSTQTPPPHKESSV